MTYTHAELVDRALVWSRTLLGAQLAIKEVSTGQQLNGETKAIMPDSKYGFTEYLRSDEQPDVWCWVAYRQLAAMPQGEHEVSVNIECKATRSDFLADRKKMTRINPEQGCGRIRWYFTNPGVITPEELPDGWGLVVVEGKRHRYLKKPKPIVQSDIGKLRDTVAMRRVAVEYQNHNSVLRSQILNTTDLAPLEHTNQMNGTRPLKVYDPGWE